MTTIKEMFGLETDAEYTARTNEEDRVKEVKEYISAVIANENYEEGYNVDNHINKLFSKGFFGEEKAQYLKTYFSGFMDGYNRAKGK